MRPGGRLHPNVADSLKEQQQEVDSLGGEKRLMDIQLADGVSLYVFHLDFPCSRVSITEKQIQGTLSVKDALT